jgi:replicative DNA helicase
MLKNIESIYKQYIHFDQEIEMAVLGQFLLEKHAFSRSVGILTKECFYYQDVAYVFSVLQEMWDESYPIDCLTVIDRIAKKDYKKIQEFNLPFFITRCTNAVVGTANLEAHCIIIKQMHIERELVKVQTQLDTDDDVIGRISSLQRSLTDLMTIKVSNDLNDMLDVVLKLHKHMDEVKDKEFIGLTTGFSKFDFITGGLAKTNMIVLAARPSVGKSAILNAMAIHQARKGYNVGIISLEMPNVQIGARMGALISDVDFYKIFRNRLDDENQRDFVYHELEKLSNLPIKISDKTGVNIHDIKAKTSQLINRKQLDILYIDYLQLLEGEGKTNFNREQEVSKLSRGIKLMAMEFNIPIVVLAQLNREAEKTNTKKPQLHHLRESGAIEQDADGVVFLHRDFKVGIERDKDGNSTEFEADLIIAKWRNGETRDIKIGFNPSQMKFYDLDAQRQTSYKNFYEPVIKDDL